MRVIATMALHYGLEYLPYAIESVIDKVDELAVFYTPSPSYGHGTGLACPDTHDELRQACVTAAEGKLTWHRGQWDNESQHRHAMAQYAKNKGYDLQLVVDSDEVWDPRTLNELLAAHLLFPERYFCLPMRHLWQGFDLVCDDPCQPVRAIHPQQGKDATVYFNATPKLWHFGYAIGDELMRYKWAIHGHKNELRPGWLEDKWLARATEDVHPTNVNFWSARPLDRNELPAIMQVHPRWK